MINVFLLVVLLGIILLLGRDVIEKIHTSRCTHVSKPTALTSVCEEESPSVDQVHLPLVPPPVIRIYAQDEIRVMG